MVGANRVDLGYLRDSRACPFPDAQTQAAFAYSVFTVILRRAFASRKTLVLFRAAKRFEPSTSTLAITCPLPL
jgi:hypothetical protein